MQIKSNKPGLVAQFCNLTSIQAMDSDDIAGLKCEVLTSANEITAIVVKTPIIPWHCGDVAESASSPQCHGTMGLLTIEVISIYLPGFVQGFDHKNVPTVPSIFSGFEKRKINIPVIRHVSCRVIK